MRDVFQEPKGVLRDGRLEHRIQVREGARPHQKAPYWLSTEQKEVLHTKLKEFKKERVDSTLSLRIGYSRLSGTKERSDVVCLY